MKRIILLSRCFARCAAVLSVLLITKIAYGNTIQEIQVKGNLRIEAQAIKSMVNIKPGVAYSAEEENDSLKALFATNLFAAVDFEKQGNVLIIKVEENPTVNKVIFEGLKKIKEKDLLKEISLMSRGIYSKAKLQQDIKKIENVYYAHGKYSVNITSELVKLDQNRVDVVFKINEGQDAKIIKINFEGNKNFKTAKLHGILNSKEKRWYSFFSSSDNYNQHKLEFDRELIKRFYRTNGYAKIVVDEPSVSNSDNQQKFYITFKVIEGDKYKITSNKLDIGPKDLNEKDIKNINKIINRLQNQVYNIEKIEESIDKIDEYLNDRGFPYIVVDIAEEINENTKSITLKFVLYAAKKYYINKINITGNRKTKDHVIRRELLLQEGDLYSSVKLSRSEHKLNELDYFDEVKVEESRDENDLVNLNIEVLEKSTLNIYFAGGYSTADGPLGDISLKDTNFLGEGYEFGAGITKASKKIDVELSLIDPYFLDSNFSAGFSVYKNSSQRNKKYSRSYDSDTAGFSLFSGYNLNQKLLYSPKYTYEKNNIKNISADATQSLKNQEGRRTTSAISHRLTYDARDSRIMPTKGIFGYIDQQFAGLGGDVKFIRHEIAASYYKPVIKEDIVLELFGKVGNIFGIGKKDVSINNTFYIGGDVLKGFEHAEVGPRERVYDKNLSRFLNMNEAGGKNGDTIGGKNFYNFSAEVKAPLSGSGKDTNIFIASFLEGGEVFANDLLKKNKGSYFDQRGVRMSVGLSLIFNTPIGPVRLNYAMPIKKKEIDKINRFSITFSTFKL